MPCPARQILALLSGKQAMSLVSFPTPCRNQWNRISFKRHGWNPPPPPALYKMGMRLNFQNLSKKEGSNQGTIKKPHVSGLSKLDAWLHKAQQNPSGTMVPRTFDRVWHEGQIYKIKSIGISGCLLILIESSLSNKYQ